MALRADGAAVPESQATPISRETLEEWSQTQELGVATAAMIAWKTMSRWGGGRGAIIGQLHTEQPFNSSNMRRSAGVEVSRIFTILHGLSRVVTTYHENSRKFTAKKHGEKS